MEQKCAQLSQICGEDQEFFNFFKLYFCQFKGSNILVVLLFVLLLIIIFKFICDVIEEYVAPGIVYICEFLKMSESLAGVTLIAFANGAGDILTAIVASDSKEGISYNIGALYGAGLFVITLIVALTILISPSEIQLSKDIIWRDIGLYILSTLYILGLALYGKINWWSSVILLCLYVVLVLIVIVQDAISRKNPEDNKTEEELE